MEQRSSPIERSIDLSLHLGIQVKNRLSPFYSVLDAGQVDEQRPLRLRPVPRWVDDRVIVMWPKVLVLRVLVHANI